MNTKGNKMGLRKRIWIISIAILMISIFIMPSPNGVVKGTTTISMELKAGWNLKGMPESMAASELALKSSHITSIVHRTSQGYYESYIPSLGETDFVLEVNEGVYIYSEADIILQFSISPSSGYNGGDLIVTGDLGVTGDCIFDNNLTVKGSISILGNFEVINLNVTEDMIIDGSLTVNEYLAVGKDLTVDGNLRVGKDLTVGNLTITENMTINNDLKVAGDAVIDGDSNVTGDITVSGNLTAGDLTAEDVTVTEDMTVNGNLTVMKDLVVGDDITVTDDMTVGDDLSVVGDIATDGNLTVWGDATIHGKLTAGDFSVASLTIEEDITINGHLTVEKDIIGIGNLLVTQDVTVGGNLTTGDLTADDVTITEDMTINGNLTVMKDLAVGDDITVTDDMTVGDDLSVAGDITTDGNLMVIGDATILGRLTAGDFTVGNLTIQEDITINGQLTVEKDIIGNGDLLVIGDAVIGGTLVAGNFTVINLTIAEDLSINGDLSITGDASIGGNLTVADDITIDGDYTVTGNMNVGGDLFVSGNLTGLALGDTADYVIGRDATGEVYAKNGINGNMDFKSTNATEVIQNAIDAVFASDRQAGTIYLKRSEYGERYDIPLRFGVRVDYTIDNTITVPPGISIISDGALFKVSDFDGTVFQLNPYGVDYGSPHLIWKISGLAFVGHKDNKNTVAIHAYRWQYPLIIDNIHCEEVCRPIKIEGTAYRTVVKDCLFIVGAGNRGEVGVHIFKGRGPYSPNGATVVNSDVSTMKVGILVDDGYGVRITNNYFEGNDIAINSSGGTVTVVGNFIQPSYNQIGILAYGGTVISGNGFLLGRSAEYARGIVMVRNEGSIMVTGNTCGTDSGNNSFFYSDMPVRGTISGNLVGLRPGGYVSKFIDAYLTGATVSGNQISRGNPAIVQKMSPAWQQNVFSDNSFFASDIAIVTGGRDCVIDNVFNACDVDIKLKGGNNVIRGNYLRGGMRIDTSEMGGGNIIEGNIGYVTENSGTTSAGTAIDVDHGLAGTPDQVSVTPLGQTNYYYVTNKGATTFTIISEASVAFDWYAVYKP